MPSKSIVRPVEPGEVGAAQLHQQPELVRPRPRPLQHGGAGVAAARPATPSRIGDEIAPRSAAGVENRAVQPLEDAAAQGALPADLIGRVEQVVDRGDALIGLAGVQTLDVHRSATLAFLIVSRGDRACL